MKIEDLVQLLNNRLREFQLSRDYAKMSGNLERMNTAEKEVLALEDTLFKLNLLIDTSKSVAVKEEILSEVITDGSVAVLGEYDITSYATDPEHEQKVMNILSKMGVMDTVEKIDKYIRSKSFSSPVTGEMVMSGASAYSVDIRLMMAIMEQDSHFGTAGVAVRTLNPGNIGNDDDGNTRTYDSWQEGVTAVAEWLSRHRGSTIIPEITEENVIEPITNSTQSTTIPTATSTPVITTSTTTTITNIPTIPTMISSQPTTSTSTIATTTQEVSTSTPEIIPVTITEPEINNITDVPQATSTIATTTQEVSTSTPEIIPANTYISTSPQPSPSPTPITESAIEPLQSTMPEPSPSSVSEAPLHTPVESSLDQIGVTVEQTTTAN